MLPRVIGGPGGCLGFISMREPADCPEPVNQKESSDGAQCNDHDGLSLRLRHLNLPAAITDKTKK
jgi:hypothetical protein